MNAHRHSGGPVVSIEDGHRCDSDTYEVVEAPPPDAPDAGVEALAERIDAAMRDHAYSHTISNNPHSFACSPSCVSQQLRIVVKRELAAHDARVRAAERGATLGSMREVIEKWEGDLTTYPIEYDERARYAAKCLELCIRDLRRAALRAVSDPEAGT